MSGRRLAALATAGAALATLVVGGGVAEAQSGAAAPGAQVQPQTQVQPNAFSCGYGALCVHLLHSDGSYTWESLYYCQTWKLNGTLTWYVNNQTPGTIATFYYPWAVSSKAPYYSGRPPVWPYDASHHAPTSVKNC
jgi:hypothetical protein